MAQIEQTYFQQVRLCLKKDHTPTLEEFQSFSVFFKQTIGIVMGVLLGVFGIKGLFAMILYLVVSFLLTQFYSKNYLDLDEDEIENISLIKEGTFQGFVCFMLVWILSFTLFHYS